MTARRLRTTRVEERSLWRLKDGREALVKISASNSRDLIERQRRKRAGERTCLEVLAGLAVPEILDLDAGDLLSHFRGQRNISCLAQSFPGERRAHALGLGPEAMVGVWVFLAEQFAAFRRRGILYCGCKCENIIGKSNPLRVTIVDFGSCSALVQGRTKLTHYGYAPGSQAPDTGEGRKPTERTLVYELALLLFHFLTDMDGPGLSTPTRGLDTAIRSLKNLGAPEMASLLTSCLDVEPTRRPRHYEEVLRRIKTVPLPPDIRDRWERLRSPYARALAQAGL